MSFLLIKIGQNEDNDVIFSHPSIAPEHAEIFVDVEGNVFLTDLGTGKDTFVNNRKLVDSIELKSIDKVTLGEGIELDWKSLLEINQSKTITVGRSQANDFVIDAPSVSENHLELTQDQNDSYFINDLASEQGTYVNGNRISEIALLKAGDVVHVGDELFLWKSIFSNSTTSAENDEVVEEVIVETVKIPVEKAVEIVVEKPIETPISVEKVIVNPEPLDYVVEVEEVEIPKVVVAEPKIEKPVVTVSEKATINQEDKKTAALRKKELIQLAIIVAVDILMMILISSMI